MERWRIRARRGEKGPHPAPDAEWYVRTKDHRNKRDWLVDIELNGPEGNRVVTGVTIRRLSEKPITARDIRRAPIDSYIWAALAHTARDTWVQFGTPAESTLYKAEARAVERAMMTREPRKLRTRGGWESRLLSMETKIKKQWARTGRTGSIPQEIARRTKTPIGTVYVQLSRARKKKRQIEERTKKGRRKE